MKHIKTRLFLFTTIITINILSICFTDIYGGGEDMVLNPSKEEESVRGPFTLPLDVSFFKKSQDFVETYSESGKWEEGMVASRVKGIFRSNGKSIANINHVWVETGSWVGEEQVTEINRDRVVLSGKNGLKRTLLMQEQKARFKVTKRIISRTKG
ncbi:glycosyl hydrolase [Candidatus Scalindua japonica]|uniref:Glycosyl hydrolase n=1 Tax=Candidatus Scalindua japonica TaxID=1284222 RepID=A0A286TYZ3_9BACT|nr:hypothetical protein [Candidatus Scalindua japonica]GAX61078.1 glycosyl hydrolase [Candidatus Scalindua japonica]